MIVQGIRLVRVLYRTKITSPKKKASILVPELTRMCGFAIRTIEATGRRVALLLESLLDIADQVANIVWLEILNHALTSCVRALF